MYLYETHLHTAPVSLCASATVRQTLEFYKDIGYAGVFITNHFIDGNINIERSLPYKERIQFYFSDYEKALKIGAELGISVFCGVEISYAGTDFLIFGLFKDWYLAHPEIEGMKKSELLTLLKDNGALIIQAHPYREATYIDHIRLFPRQVHGVEIYNASRNEFENSMAEYYARYYGLLPFAGSDNHRAGGCKRLGGLSTREPIRDEGHFISLFLDGKTSVFKLDNPLLKDNSKNSD